MPTVSIRFLTPSAAASTGWTNTHRGGYGKHCSLLCSLHPGSSCLQHRPDRHRPQWAFPHGNQFRWNICLRTYGLRHFVRSKVRDEAHRRLRATPHVHHRRVTGGGLIYVAMKALMTAGPLMAQTHHHSGSTIAHLVQMHMIGMYLPIIVVTLLIGRFGGWTVSAAGSSLARWSSPAG